MENFEENKILEEETQIESQIREEKPEEFIAEEQKPKEFVNEDVDSQEFEQKTENTGYQSPIVGQKNPISDAYGFNKVNVSPIVATKDYTPISKGLKVFAAIMALIIIMTGCCAVGFFFGKSGNTPSVIKKISVSLSSRPKDTDELSATEVYEKVNKSIVGITIYNKSGEAAQASGVIYSADGYVVTNDHIYSEISAPLFKVYDYEGKEYDAEYVAGDTISDLALIKIKDAKDLSVPDFGNSEELIFGENVVAIGRPSDAMADSSITSGIVSHTKRRMPTTSNYSSTLIQTDSAINPGSSGGALVNMYGQIVGITSSKLAGVNYDSMGFAIPTTTMKRVVTQLADKGKVEDRAKLGITYQEITSVKKETGDYKAKGLYIVSVSEDSDLFGKATEGDIITHINGKAINRSDDVLDVIEDSYAGDTITLKITHSNGEEKEYSIKLKANVGESSYNLTTKGFSDSETPKLPGENGNNEGGTFDFPKGE